MHGIYFLSLKLVLRLHLTAVWVRELHTEGDKPGVAMYIYKLDGLYPCSPLTSKNISGVHVTYIEMASVEITCRNPKES